EVTAFDSVMNKLGMTPKARANKNGVDSDHTRTTAASSTQASGGDSVANDEGDDHGFLNAVLTESTHARGDGAAGSNSFDAVYTLNNNATVVTNRSFVTQKDAPQFCYMINPHNSNDKDNDDDDESTWFGFREGLIAAPELLLGPASSTYTEGDSTKYHTDVDDTDIDEKESLLDNEDDEENDDDEETYTDVLTAVLQSVDDDDEDDATQSDMSNLITSSASMTVADDDRTASEELELDPATEASFWKVVEIVTPKFLLRSSSEIAFQALQDMDNEEEEDDDDDDEMTHYTEYTGATDNDTTTVIDDNDAATLIDDDDNSALFEDQAKGTPIDDNEPIQLVIDYNDTTTSFEDTIVLEDEPTPEVVENTLTFVWPFASAACNSPEHQFCCNCSDSRGDVDSTSSILQEDEPIAMTEEKKQKQKMAEITDDCKEDSDNESDDDVEGKIAIMVKDSDDSRKSVVPDDEEVEILLNEHMETVAKIESIAKEVDEIDQNVDVPLTEEIEIGSSGDQTVENIVTNGAPPSIERAFSSGDSFSINGVSSSDSLCIPEPPKRNKVDSVSPSNSSSYDSSVLSYSTDDMAMLRESSKTGASHRRRHSFDHIPTSCKSAVLPEMSAVLPFLVQKKMTLKENMFPAEKSEEQIPTTESTMPLTLRDNSNGSDSRWNDASSDTRSESSFLSIWNDIHDSENMPCNTDESSHIRGLSIRMDEEQDIGKPPLSCKAVNNIAVDFVKVVDPIATVKLPVKGILKKAGAAGSGRSISWNEEQLEEKQDKGILGYSRRDGSRSVCPLDQLVSDINEIHDNRHHHQQPQTQLEAW
ncbi:MAG: hypothetical protein SGILL_007162, partial [Bacillariaceae sp.]